MMNAKRALLCASALLVATPAWAQQIEQVSASTMDAEPAPPTGASANQIVPVHDAAGVYETPNHGLSREEAAWHVRAALNVAALGCRDADEDLTVAAYNSMLHDDSVPLAAADAAVRAQYRARFGLRWQDRHDVAMTRVYNFFSQPPAHQAFCAAAREVLAQLPEIDAEHFLGFAAEALPRLEAPFTDFYRAYDGYRASLVSWRAAHVRPAVLTELAAVAGPAQNGPAQADAVVAPVQVAAVAAPTQVAAAIAPTQLAAAVDPAPQVAAPAPTQLASAVVPTQAAAATAPTEIAAAGAPATPTAVGQ